MTLLLPALFAALVAIGATVAIERFGGKLGGLLSTLPTTIVPAALGIYAQSADAEAFRAAMYVTPAGMLIDAGFLYLWRFFPSRLPAGWSIPQRLIVMVLATLGLWLLAASLTVWGMDALRASEAPLWIVGWGVTAAIALSGVLACRNLPPAPRGSRKVGWGMLLMRGVLAGSAIAVSVYLARVSGPFAAGVAAVFPAIFVTTMVALWISQGESVQAGAVGPMMLGSTSVAGFAVVAAWSIPALGGAWGAVVAWSVSVVGATMPAWWWLNRRR